MSFEQVTSIQIVCDFCKARFEYDGYTPLFATESPARKVSA